MISFKEGLPMVAQRDPQQMTVDEWRELERTSHDTKHEYIDGQVYAMSGGSLAHGSIGSNTVRTLQDALRAAGKPCYTYNSDVAVRLSARRYTYPDASLPFLVSLPRYSSARGLCQSWLFCGCVALDWRSCEQTALRRSLSSSATRSNGSSARSKRSNS